MTDAQLELLVAIARSILALLESGQTITPYDRGRLTEQLKLALADVAKERK